MVEKKDRDALSGREYMMRFTVLLLASFILMEGIGLPGAVSAQDEPMPLAEQLEGLEPGPRIAYLKHLLATGDGRAEVYFQLGVAFHEGSQPDSAITYYEKAIRTDPDSYKAFVNLGVLYDEKGEIATALENFSKAVHIKPRDVLANSHMAYLLFRKNVYDRAWEHLAIALEEGADHPQPHFYLAIFFWESRIFREAMVEWEKVVALSPDSYLAAKARENIMMMQSVLKEPPQAAQPAPESD